MSIASFIINGCHSIDGVINAHTEATVAFGERIKNETDAMVALARQKNETLLIDTAARMNISVDELKTLVK